jgi:hypothetical protein
MAVVETAFAAVRGFCNRIYRGADRTIRPQRGQRRITQAPFGFSAGFTPSQQYSGRSKIFAMTNRFSLWKADL